MWNLEAKSILHCSREVKCQLDIKDFFKITTPIVCLWPNDQHYRNNRAEPSSSSARVEHVFACPF